MFKKLIGIIIVIFIINSAGVLLIGGGSAGIAAEQEDGINSAVMIKTALVSLNKAPIVQSRADEYRTLFIRIMAKKYTDMKALSISEKCLPNYYKSMVAMAVINSELKNIRKINLMNYLLAERTRYVHPKAINQYLTLNFAMLKRSVYEIEITIGIIKDQARHVESKEAVDLCKKMLALEEKIVEHFYSFYEVFKSE